MTAVNEYKVQTVRSSGSDRSLSKYLNRWLKEGWQLHSVLPVDPTGATITFVFSR